jgi:hypothetical protein
MNVASVTVTAMIHGLIDGRPGAEPVSVMSFAWAMS